MFDDIVNMPATVLMVLLLILSAALLGVWALSMWLNWPRT